MTESLPAYAPETGPEPQGPVLTMVSGTATDPRRRGFAARYRARRSLKKPLVVLLLLVAVAGAAMKVTGRQPSERPAVQPRAVLLVHDLAKGDSRSFELIVKTSIGAVGWTKSYEESDEIRTKGTWRVVADGKERTDVRFTPSELSYRKNADRFTAQRSGGLASTVHLWINREPPENDAPDLQGDWNPGNKRLLKYPPFGSTAFPMYSTRAVLPGATWEDDSTGPDPVFDRKIRTTYRYKLSDEAPVAGSRKIIVTADSPIAFALTPAETTEWFPHDALGAPAGMFKGIATGRVLFDGTYTVSADGAVQRSSGTFSIYLSANLARADVPQVFFVVSVYFEYTSAPSTKTA